MSEKCPKCGIEGERITDCAIYVMCPPESGKTGPFGRAKAAGKYHLIDSPQCLTRQLDQAKAENTKLAKQLAQCCEALEGEK